MRRRTAVAPIPWPRAAAIASTIADRAEEVRFIVPSHDPADPRLDAKRYWRGPVWLVVNYMIADGPARAGEARIAARITASSLDLIRERGFAEYYDPRDGPPPRRRSLSPGRRQWCSSSSNPATKSLSEKVVRKG